MPLSLKIAKGILFSLAPIIIITSFLFFSKVRNIRNAFILSKRMSEMNNIIKKEIAKGDFNP